MVCEHLLEAGATDSDIGSKAWDPRAPAQDGFVKFRIEPRIATLLIKIPELELGGPRKELPLRRDS